MCFSSDPSSKAIASKPLFTTVHLKPLFLQSCGTDTVAFLVFNVLNLIISLGFPAMKLHKSLCKKNAIENNQFAKL